MTAVRLDPLPEPVQQWPPPAWPGTRRRWPAVTVAVLRLAAVLALTLAVVTAQGAPLP